MNDISRRLAASSGAFSIVAVIIGGGPIDSESAAGLVLLTASFLAFVVFIGYLHPVLERAEGRAGWLATAALVAGVLHVASRFELLAAENGTHAVSGPLADQLQTLNERAFVVSGLLLGMYVACASMVCVGHEVLPRWLGWFGVTGGALTVVVGTAGLVDTGWWIPWPFLASAIWVLVTSVLLVTRAGQPATDDARSAAIPAAAV
jgi:hypothetical protein